MTLLIKNGKLIDPASGMSAKKDVFVEGTTISRITDPDSKNADHIDTVIDAQGCVVCPGLVDIHVHFREPGQESKETIASGSRAAARGGFTSVVPMPNTKPPIDNAGMVEFVIRRARETACIKIWPSASATKERAGKEITEMAELRDVGVVAVTDDGSDISNSWVMRRVLEYANMCGLTYLAHCEDLSLIEDGVMNEGFNATKLGLPGMPKAAEEIMVDRNIRLAELAGSPIHIQHVSTAGSVDIIRRAKARGLKVTCETAPHYWTLTDDAVLTFSTNAKMNPPLREAVDVAAIREAMADGTIDCIATDHAPHTFTEKDVEFQPAPFGVVGLETVLALTITELVEPGVISLERAIDMMTATPARILNLPVGTLREGGPADIAVFDPTAEWTVDATVFASLSSNTPFAGRRVQGRVRWTLCDGKIVYQDDQG